MTTPPVEYARDNDFYYVPGQAFRVPVWPAEYKVMNGERLPLMLDGKFAENPGQVDRQRLARGAAEIRRLV